MRCSEYLHFRSCRKTMRIWRSLMMAEDVSVGMWTSEVVLLGPVPDIVMAFNTGAAPSQW